MNDRMHNHSDQVDVTPSPVDGPQPPEAALPTDASPPARRPRIWPVFVVPLLGVSLAVFLQIAVAAVFTAALLASGVDSSQLGDRIMEWITSSAGFLAMLACGQIGFAAPTLLAAKLSPAPMRRRLGLVPLHNPVRISCVTALGSLLPLAIGIGLVHLVLQFKPGDETFENFFDQLTPWWGVVFVVTIALAPGFFEEMLFRGYIQRRLLERWRPDWAIGVATLLFTLAHITPHAMAVALPLGAWFGYIAWRTGSIVPTIVCHAFVNGGLNAWRLIAMYGEFSERAQLIGNVVFVGIGVVFFVLACRMLTQYPPPEQSPSAEPSPAAPR